MKNLQTGSETKNNLQITINGTSHEWESREITYDDIVKLAYGELPSDPRTYFTVTYKRGQGNGEQGNVAPGQTFKVTNKMKFYVSASNQS